MQVALKKGCKLKNEGSGVHFWEVRFIMDYLYDSRSTLLFNSSAYCATIQTFNCSACREPKRCPNVFSAGLSLSAGLVVSPGATQKVCVGVNLTVLDPSCTGSGNESVLGSLY